MKFERVKQIPKRLKSIVYGFIRKTGCNLSIKHEVPELIYFIVLLFYYNSLRSSILTDEESDKLLSLFEQKDKFNHLTHYSFNLIHKASKNGWSDTAFDGNCHGKKDILCIMRTKTDDVFGGYTSTGWVSYGEQKEDPFHSSDDKAFILSVRTEGETNIGIFDVKSPKDAIRTQREYYCHFGSNSVMYVWEDKQTAKVNVYSEESFEPFEFVEYGYEQDVIEIEAFQLN